VVGYQRLGITTLCRNAGDNLPRTRRNNLELGRPKIHRRKCLKTRMSFTVRVINPTQETSERKFVCNELGYHILWKNLCLLK